MAEFTLIFCYVTTFFCIAVWPLALNVKGRKGEMEMWDFVPILSFCSGIPGLVPMIYYFLPP